MTGATAGTLGGQSVREWLADKHGDHATSMSQPRPPRPSRARTAGVVMSPLWWLLGVSIGVAVAVPALLHPGNCPPAHEGAVYCVLQHGLLRALMTVLLCTALTVLLPRWLATAPAAIQRLREERRHRAALGHLGPNDYLYTRPRAEVVKPHA